MLSHQYLFTQYFNWNDMKKFIFTVYVALILSVSNTANATIIEIDSAADTSNNGLWDISLFNGKVEDTNVLAILSQQVWWQNSTLAGLFAVKLEIGSGNVTSSGVGPAFMYQSNLMRACQTFSNTYTSCNNGGVLTTFSLRPDRLFTFATATRVPEPSSFLIVLLSLFGLVVFKRKLNLK